jgi:hypothetical protein
VAKLPLRLALPARLPHRPTLFRGHPPPLPAPSHVETMVDRNTSGAQEVLQSGCRLQGTHVHKANSRDEGAGMERRGDTKDARPRSAGAYAFGMILSKYQLQCLCARLPQKCEGSSSQVGRNDSTRSTRRWTSLLSPRRPRSPKQTFYSAPLHWKQAVKIASTFRVTHHHLMCGGRITGLLQTV